MARHPYASLPVYTRWSKSIAAPAYSDVDPVTAFRFKIKTTDKVATAGSCFAQHIARHLRSNGFNYYVTETIHPIFAGIEGAAEAYNYGTFSARYGNLYTSRQLLQLIKRVYGDFKPAEAPWAAEGGLLDPFRPAIQPGGFSSLAELEADRRQHLDRVRHMFETLDVFVFTLGLTEFWFSKADGAVLPVCPGVAGGEFSEERYGFGNLNVSAVLDEMNEFIAMLKAVNPNAKIILTVSPVPLAATAEDRNVLVSTTYSKSVLRVACDELRARHDFIEYFPSYEIITGAFNRGRYYAEDLRSVTEEGVSHVMRLFLEHVAEGGEPQPRVEQVAADDGFLASMQKVVETTCEELLIEASLTDDALDTEVATYTNGAIG